ncbi:PGAP1-like protein-domain-containing protein [Hysterangium stoloniferum]|nr:PGAP1-like protein-domain-containing protein [Hysterangium stoloniferum]
MVRWRASTTLLGIVTFIFLVAVYTSITQLPDRLSPQGCRMSYMSPSYILQSDFNSSWTRLARRYSLWLYHEEGWEPHGKLNGVPVLFIPGNAGSSRQVRSIASSAARQFYSEPYKISPEFVHTRVRPLNFFAVDFNEDFSALHGPTLLSERTYTSAAINYILSLYPSGTQVILMGHSMGGIIASSLLPFPNISAVITMSTPHSLPPARLDKRIEDIYSQSWAALQNATTPILSICGGATDLMIPSETCSMHRSAGGQGWRKSIFTTCMEGTWTGVGHREMVWCHQVRWRVARAALELSSTQNGGEKGNILSHWFRDEMDHDSLTHGVPPLSAKSNVHHIAAGHRITLWPAITPALYLLPIDYTSPQNLFTLYVSQGKFGNLSPYRTSGLEVTLYRCRETSDDCEPFYPESLKLIPNPVLGVRFPVSGEGIDEADGVVRFQASVTPKAPMEPDGRDWVGVALKSPAHSTGWIVGGFEGKNVINVNVSQFAPLLRIVNIPLNPTALTTSIHLPHLLSSALLVYRIEKPKIVGSCANALMPPLILHRTSSSESHFHPTDGVRKILIHTHSSGPFISSSPEDRRGLDLIVYSSGQCGISELALTVDWWASLSTWGLRYWTTVIAWSTGVVGILIVYAWNVWEKGGHFPTIWESLWHFTSQTMVPLSVVFGIASCLPFGVTVLLGNGGELIISPLAALVLYAASGCVVISWITLQVIMWFVSKVGSILERIHSVTVERHVWRRNIWSLGLVLLLVATIIPSQVAFLVCFMIHLFTCATQTPSSTTPPSQVEAHAQKTYILLLLFWLLPLVAPVLAVWVRTLATAGGTTPFDGDHDVLAIASFLLFVDYTSSGNAPLFERATSRLQRYVILGVLYSLAVIPFAFGGRYTYHIYTASNFVVAYLVLARVGTRLWKVSSR